MYAPGFPEAVSSVAHSGLSVQSNLHAPKYFLGCLLHNPMLMYLDSPLGLFLFPEKILYS